MAFSVKTVSNRLFYLQTRRTFRQTAVCADKKKNKSGEDEMVSKKVVEAAKGIAEVLGSDGVANDLLGKLRGLSEEERKENADLPKLRNVLSDMKIEQAKNDRPPRTEGLPAQLMKPFERVVRKPKAADSWTELKTLYDSQPLGIFVREDLTKSTAMKSTKTSLFDELMNEEQNMLTKTFARNAFEEQIQWTEEGKLWHFPIDNEFKWDEEANTSFVDHVFVERLLNEKRYNFPKAGPVRHFMELVCVGLSKNAFMSAKQKREVVSWFANYFKDKYAIIEKAVADAEKAKAREHAAASQ